jgi:hypothetical protein
MKRVIVTILFSVFLVSLVNPNSASAVDFQDYKTPIIQEFKQNMTPIYDENEYFIELEYEITVKSFSNQLSGINLAFTYEQKQYPAGCQLLSRSDYPVLGITYGSNSGKLDSLGQPSGIVSVEKNNGYQIEKHKFKYSTKNLRDSLNTKFKFCKHTLKLDYVSIWDVGGHRNDISFNHNNYYNPDFYNRYPSQSFQTFKELFTGNLINNPVCPSIAVPYAWHTSEILYSVCNHTSSLGSLSIALSPELSDAAKVSADKAAADKLAADRAAASNKEMNETFIALSNNLNKYKTDIAQIFRDYPAYFNQSPELRSSLQRAIDYKIPAVASQSGIDAIRDLIGGGSGSALASDFLLAQAGITKYVALENIKAKTAKRTTITCVKGKLSKKVSAVNPTCPAGYRVKK